MTTATVVLGVSVGAAFALIVLVLVVAYCIYTHKNPERRHGGTRKVRPINFVELKGLNRQPITKSEGDGFCLCCIQSPSDNIPPPDPPIKIELKDLRHDSAIICWKPPVAYAAAGLDNYVIYLRPSDKPDNWTKVAKAKKSETHHFVQQLESDKRYVLGVASKNKGGESTIIETRPFILRKQMKAEIPEKPTSVVVKDVHSDGLTLQWEPPKNYGNAKIEFYHVAVSNEQNKWNQLSKEAAVAGVNHLIVKVLHKNTPYRFRIFAENSIGFGPFAETKEPVFLKKEPEPPLKPLGPIRYNRTTHSSVTLSWKQRTKERGNLPVYSYIIEMLDPPTDKWRQIGETTENVTTYCVPKLPEDTELKFRVIAVNAAGKSAPLVVKMVRTMIRESSTYGSASRSPKSAHSESTSSNTKFSKSALQRVLAQWERSGQQVPPRATNPASVTAGTNSCQ